MEESNTNPTGLDSDAAYAQAQVLGLNVPNWCPPEGKLSSAIALIGEAPGTQECRLRRPFCGPAGQLLDKLLLRASIDRGECYITNTIKEQPSGNIITPFLDLSKRVPIEGPKWSRYRDLLQSELAESSANVLVAVGGVALYALTGKKLIGKQRGSVLESTLLPGRKVIPILHPASILREYLFTHPTVWDLKRIKKESLFPEIRRTDRNIILDAGYSQILGFLYKLKESMADFGPTEMRYTELDIEILNEEISCLCIGNHLVGTMVISFIGENGDNFQPDQEINIWSALADLFEDPAIFKLGQNITFDITFIYRKYGIRTFPICDTMVAQGIAFPGLPKGLDYLTSIYTDEPYYKDDGKRWFKLGGSLKDLWLYNGKDGAVLPYIHNSQLNELAKQGNLKAYQKQLELIEPLVYMQERGIKCNAEGLQKASKESEEKILSLTDELHSLCGFELNPGSPKQLADYFYVKKGFKPYTNRKTGNVSTDRDALKRLSRKGSREAQILLELRKVSKLKSTYLDMSLDSDSRIRCSFNPVGTTSGRLSSSKTIFGTGGNMQNLPPDFKKYLLFDTDYIGYNVDLSQAENRTVAYVAPDELMIRAFEEGLDVHSLTGSLISGLPYELIKEQDDKGVYCEIGGGLYTWRFWGKKANHGLNYDLGFRTFAFYYEIPERDAQYIVERYHQAYPGVRLYHAWVRNKINQGRILENCFGRKRLFLDRYGDALFKEAYSYIPQSSIADKLNHQGVIPAYYDPKFTELDLLNQVHDSLVFQIHKDIPIQRHVEILFDLRKSLETPMVWDGRSFVIPMDIEAAPSGGNLGKYSKDKEGKPGNLLGLRKLSGKTKEELTSELSSIFELTIEQAV